MPAPIKTYRINLVRSLRELERRRERKRRLRILVGIACFATLALAVAYTAYTARKMESVLASEARKLADIKAEYNKYTATRMIVEKGDVELLNALQGRGIFWTRKLAALATHLPDNCILTGFSYKDGELRVSGYGDAAPSQDQLLILDGYLGRLRRDTSFSSVFRQIHLNFAQREDGGTAGRFGFEFSAVNPAAGRKK